MDLTDIYRTFHPTTADNIFFSNIHEKFSSINYMIGHRKSLNTYKNIEILSIIFSNHNGIKLKNRLQEENWKIYRYYVKSKQYSTEQPAGQRR